MKIVYSNFPWFDLISRPDLMRSLKNGTPLPVVSSNGQKRISSFAMSSVRGNVVLLTFSGGRGVEAGVMELHYAEGPDWLQDLPEAIIWYPAHGAGPTEYPTAC